MKNVFKKIIKYLLLHHLDLFPATLTNKEELKLLIQKLHPKTQQTKFKRLGPLGDGGYLVPDDFKGIEACFSPGVSSIIGFEKDCADLGMKVFMADGSVDGTIEFHKNFSFIKKYIGATNNDNFITLDEWVNTSPLEVKSDLLLQMDIEGYEYETFISITNKLMKRFRIIVVEFHNLDLLWCQPFYKLASRAFEKILQTHTCVHIHPNNYLSSKTIYDICIPYLMEFTFLRNDRIINAEIETVFPHPLDSDNIESNQTLVLPKCWYEKA